MQATRENLPRPPNDRHIELNIMKCTWAVFGEEGVDPLLGAYTLEGLRMSVDPWKHTLIPMPYGWA